MNIYSILTLIGGLAFFLYGISIMSSGLEKIAGGRLEKLLKKMTSNPIKSFTLGMVITAVIQSSSAVTVMLIGLVNSGIMNLSQTVSVIIGANVGTTITAWLLSLTAIEESAGAVLKLFKPETFAPVLALIGVILILASKNNRRKSIGSVLIGFAILMSGMELMSGAMTPLGEMDEFRNLMVAFKNPILGFLVGLFMTMIIQSSSASIGILQALTLVGGVSWGVAIPIILGQNLGTCISALIASIGVNINAKRVAGVHIIYNILSVGICFPLFIILQLIFHFSFVETDINPFGVAIFHTIYNILTAFMLFPFAKLIEKLAVKYIKESNKDNQEVFLDDRLLLSSVLAVSQAIEKAADMGDMVYFNYTSSAKLIESYDSKILKYIENNENKIDLFEDKLGSFLIKLSNQELIEEDNNKISQLLNVISEFEKMADHCLKIAKIAQELNDIKYNLSFEAKKELETIINAVDEVFNMSFIAFKNNDLSLANKIEALGDVIKKGVRRAKNNHIQRLKEKQCSIEIGFLYSDLLNDFSRFSAHCINIGLSVIQLYYDEFDKHKYSHRDKESDINYKNKYLDYKNRYKVIKKESMIEIN